MDQTTPDNLSTEEVWALDLEFDLWVMEGACRHRFMLAASERISNWSGLRGFQNALRSLGEGSNATLLREIPDINGGLTMPADARTCLAELDDFCSTGPFGQVIELVDGGSGGVIHSRVVPYDGWLGSYGTTGLSRWLTLDGQFQIERGQAGLMRHDPNAKVLFRSRAFSQAKTPAGELCFTDLSSGKQILCPDGFEDASGSYPALLKVTQGEDAPARYAYCVEPLRRVFQAAIDTGHSVLWT